jgi:hypothetical protein
MPEICWWLRRLHSLLYSPSLKGTNSYKAAVVIQDECQWIDCVFKSIHSHLLLFKSIQSPVIVYLTKGWSDRYKWSNANEAPWGEVNNDMSMWMDIRCLTLPMNIYNFNESFIDNHLSFRLWPFELLFIQWFRRHFGDVCYFPGFSLRFCSFWPLSEK